MRIGQISWLALVPLTLSLVAAAQPADAAKKHHHAAKGGGGGSNSIVAVANRNGCDLFDQQLKKGGLTGLLSGGGPYTVFAPNDSAFQHLAKDAIGEGMLPKTLKYHVVKGNYSLTDLSTRRSIPTLEGEDVMLNSKDGKLIVDGAIVTKPDIKCSNGVIHVIDTVLLPQRGK